MNADEIGIDEWTPLYTQPPSTQAAVAAALRKAAEVCGEARTLGEADILILALPHDDSALRELIATAIEAGFAEACNHGDMHLRHLQEIVSRVLGEAK